MGSDPAPPSHAQLAVLLFSIFTVAVCGLTYELLCGAVSSYLLGGAVRWYSFTIGAFMTAMGVGAWLSRWCTDRLLERFILVELLIGVVGGIAGPLLFAAYTYTALYHVALFTVIVLIGIGTGLELPLLTRWLQPHQSLRAALSDVLVFDYIGALVASLLFPLVLLPTLGLIKTFPAVGLLNIAVAGLTAAVFARQLRGARWLLALALAGLLLLGGLLSQTERFLSVFESRLYQDTVIYAEQTPYQRIVLTRYQDDIRLYLDGHVQFSSRDEARYHESLVHPTLSAVPSAERVLLLGAGDGLAARELLQHPGVSEITLVDLDPAMTRLGSSHPDLRAINHDSLLDPRLTIVHDDAYTFLEHSSDLYAAIIIDLPDPHNEALAKLYSRSFYQLVSRHLAPGGIAVTQASSPYFARDAFWCVVETIESTGMTALLYHTWVPVFGEWGFVMMRNGPLEPDAFSAWPEARWLTDAQLPPRFLFPPDMARVPAAPSTLADPTIMELYRRGWATWFQ